MNGGEELRKDPGIPKLPDLKLKNAEKQRLHANSVRVLGIAALREGSSLIYSVRILRIRTR